MSEYIHVKLTRAQTEALLEVAREETARRNAEDDRSQTLSRARNQLELQYMKKWPPESIPGKRVGRVPKRAK